MTDYYRLPRVTHDPIAPPRPCTPGEGIYLDLWRKWATENPSQWAAIFRAAVFAGASWQQCAAIGASFMVFMGCNGGRSFTHHAESLASKNGMPRFDAFRAAWAIENTRTRGVNHGIRTVEYMLAAEHPVADAFLGWRADWTKVPKLTMADIDAVDSTVDWWADDAAAQMRKIAEPLIDTENRIRLARSAAGSELHFPAVLSDAWVQENSVLAADCDPAQVVVPLAAIRAADKEGGAS